MRRFSRPATLMNTAASAGIIPGAAPFPGRAPIPSTAPVAVMPGIRRVTGVT